MKRAPEVQAYLDRAWQTLDAARHLLTGGFSGDAVSRAYYAMFYAAQALLISEGIERTKHSAVEAALGQYFVKTGKIPAELHRSFVRARGLRETSDYDTRSQVSDEAAEVEFSEAETFVTEIARLLS